MASVVQLGPNVSLKGVVHPPGDKSISHRLVMLASIAEGKSRFSGLLRSDDCQRTIDAMRAMGISIRETNGGSIEVDGKGLRGLRKPEREIYAGNSGTTIRLLLGLLAGQSFDTVLTGDESLCKRPMRRVTDPLRLMGASIEGQENGNYAPIRTRSGSLTPIRFENHLASAQVKSALLLAGLYAKGITEIIEPRPSRDHTERLLRAMGGKIIQTGSRIQLTPVERLSALEMTVPGDLSSAAFWLAAGAIQPGVTIRVENVGLNPTRMGFVKAIKKMGAKMDVHVQDESIEPVGYITVTGSPLKGVTLTEVDIPSIIDELPLIMVLASLAKGRTTIHGAEELRVKETDRIYAMVKNLDILGVSLQGYPDGVEIDGQEQGFLGGKVESFGDHRIAMAMAIASLRAQEPIEIHGADCVDISYPDFFKDFERIRV